MIKRPKLDNLSTQFKQLPMFMSAREIRSNYQALAGDRKSTSHVEYESDDQLYARKATEAKSKDWAGLHESVATHGVKTPVHLSVNPPLRTRLNAPKTKDWETPQVLGGHHRIAAASDTAPDRLIPVMHHENMQDAKNGPWQDAYQREYH